MASEGRTPERLQALEAQMVRSGIDPAWGQAVRERFRANVGGV